MVRPSPPPARARLQGGGTANTDDEAVFAAVVYVLVSGCSWRHLPPCFGASKSTVHRRFRIKTRTHHDEAIAWAHHGQLPAAA